jgi:hypothetical protein
MSILMRGDRENFLKSVRRPGGFALTYLPAGGHSLSERTMTKPTDDFALYMRWQKYILTTYPELDDGIKRSTLIAYCFAMAVKGRNGRRCFASDETIGKEIGVARR